MTNLIHAQVTEAAFTRSVGLPSPASHRRPKARRALCHARGLYCKRAFPSHRLQGLFSPAALSSQTRPRRAPATQDSAPPAPPTPQGWGPPPPALSGLRPSLAPGQAAGSRSRSPIPEPAVHLPGTSPGHRTGPTAAGSPVPATSSPALRTTGSGEAAEGGPGRAARCTCAGKSSGYPLPEGCAITHNI